MASSLTLTLIPLWSSTDMVFIGLADQLAFDPDSYRVFAQLRDLSDWSQIDPAILAQPSIKTRPLPDHVVLKRMTSDGSIEQIKTDAFGALRCVGSKELKTLAVGPDATRRNYSLKAYLNSLPDDMNLVLYWGNH